MGDRLSCAHRNAQIEHTIVEKSDTPKRQKAFIFEAFCLLEAHMYCQNEHTNFIEMVMVFWLKVTW